MAKHPQKWHNLPTLVDVPEQLFLDMTIEISIAIFKRHSFATSRTSNQMCQ